MLKPCHLPSPPWVLGGSTVTPTVWALFKPLGSAAGSCLRSETWPLPLPWSLPQAPHPGPDARTSAEPSFSQAPTHRLHLVHAKPPPRIQAPAAEVS